MKKFFIIRITRSSAFAMLLVWAFALFSGVVNACLLEASGAPAHTGMLASSTHDGGKHAGLVGHAQTGVTADQEDDAHTSKQPCLKVCDDSSKSLPKKYPTSQTDPGPPVIVAVLWTAVTPLHFQFDQPDGTQRVTSWLPLRVRYARLAL